LILKHLDLFEAQIGLALPVAQTDPSTATMKPVIHREHVLKSHLPGVESIPNIDIYTFIFEREKHGNYPPIKSPDRVAHINGLTGERILFRELKTRVNSLARSLRHTIGIHDHDVVCF
jgi:hypothetical protein